jgi:hypothetical protein
VREGVPARDCAALASYGRSQGGWCVHWQASKPAQCSINGTVVQTPTVPVAGQLLLRLWSVLPRLPPFRGCCRTSHALKQSAWVGRC